MKKRRKTAAAGDAELATAAAPVGDGDGDAVTSGRKRRRPKASAPGAEAEAPAEAAEGAAAPAAPAARRRPKRSSGGAPEPGGDAEADAEDAEAGAEGFSGVAALDLDGEENDKKGIIHLSSLPPFLHPDKLRHMMEQFGQVGRVYLSPEDASIRKRRIKFGGNRKMKYSEGWVEFLDRRLAKRVAYTLNGTSVGGRKRHNYYRDDMWCMKYLPKFKWSQLKEGAVYNNQVRKARLEQRVNQARRENNLFLERVEEAKRRRYTEARRAKKGIVKPSGKAPRGGPSGARPEGHSGRVGKRERQAASAKAKSAVGREAPISDRVLDNLF